ncbi:hypothetical protein ACTFIY_010859 [Dictyostelium cf. discoideum]
MKNFLTLTIICLFVSFMSFVKCGLPEIEINSIQTLIELYNVPQFSGCDSGVCDYCSQPFYFHCDETNTNINKIHLIGSGPILIEFPDVLKNFFFLKSFHLENSKSPYLLIGNSIIVSELILNNCSLDFIPPVFSFSSITMIDVSFNGDLDISSIMNLQVFKLTYSNSLMMGNYSLTNYRNVDLATGVLEITINNLLDFSVKSPDVTFILGKYFNGSTMMTFPFVQSRKLKVIDEYYNLPIRLPEMINLETERVEFEKINFDTLYNLNFSHLTSLTVLSFTSCSGIIDTVSQYPRVIFGERNYDTVKYVNCGLNILPPNSYFQGKFLGIDLSNNNITSELPNIFQPNDTKPPLNMVFSNNKFYGDIPINFCYHTLNISNNNFETELPMCFICHYYSIKDSLMGNKYTNMVNGKLPNCTGIKFTSNAVFALNEYSFVEGENLGWSFANQESIVATPLVSLTTYIPNKKMKIYFSTMASYPILKKNNFIINLFYKEIPFNTTINVEISPPIIKNIFPDSRNMESTSFMIVGVALQSDGSPYEIPTIYFDNLQCIVKNVTNISPFCTINSFIADKIYNVTYYLPSTNLTSEIYQFDFIRSSPFIFKIISPKRDQGGLVQFLGYYSLYNITRIEIGGNVLDVLFFNTTLITTSIGAGSGPLKYNITFDNIVNHVGTFRYSDDPIYCDFCNEFNGGGVCNTTIGKCECSNKYQGSTCTITSQYVSSIIPSSTEGGLAIFNGWFGNNPHTNLKVFIGDKPCFPIYTTNETTITCEAQPGDGIFTIQVNQNSVNYTLKNSYEYFKQIKECPNDCTSKFNGQCNKTTGFCNCFTNWYGFDCSIFSNQSPNSNTSIDYNNGNTNITNQETIFQISFYSLLEIDINGKTVNEYQLNNNWIINNNNSNSNEFIYSFIQSIQNNGSCNITYRIEEIQVEKNISFAGIDYSIEGGSIKTTISIENYKYSSNLNTLQLQFKSLAIGNKNFDNDDECNIEEKDTIIDNNQQGYVTIIKNSKILIGRFLNRIISDGKSTFISTSLISKSNDSIIVGMNLPHCINCFIDPDYSVLVTPDFKSDCENSENNKKQWLIPVVVVVPIVAISLIVAISYIIYRKKINRKFKNKLKMIELSNK